MQNEIEKRINPQRQNRSDHVAANGNGQSRAGCSKNPKSKNCSTPTRNKPLSRRSKSETGEHSSRSTRNKSAPAHGQKNRSTGHKVVDLDRKQWTWHTIPGIAGEWCARQQNRNTKTGNEIGKQETEIGKQETEISRARLRQQDEQSR
jgi:hypothetical protein